MNKRWDVLSAGCTAVDELLYVSRYPPADAKVAIERRERQCGGLAATALVAAARQGARCAYAGALGEDLDSNFVREAMRTEGIDLSITPFHPSARPIRSTIIVDQNAHSRNIFFQRPAVFGPLSGQPTAEQVGASRVLFVDHYGGAATVRLQNFARLAGVPVVADLERHDAPEFQEILRLSDHLIISERFAATLCGRLGADAALLLLGTQHQVVVVTAGAAGCWAIERGETEAKRYPAFSIDTVDTTGCGDTFHGVYAAELARGLPLPQRILRASAAAALKAAHHGTARNTRSLGRRFFSHPEHHARLIQQLAANLPM